MNRPTAIRRLLLTAGLVLGFPLVACTTGTTGDGSAPTELRVSAAASLSDAFAEIEAAFEAAHRSIDVVLNLGGSALLREQILGGAPAHVFASADTANMDRVVRAGAVDGEPRIFAVNHMRIAVPVGNPAAVAGLADFANDELLIGLCAAGVPCGDFARQVLERAGVEVALDTNEPNVRGLLTKIEAGELDAGIVYGTDVAASADVDDLDIPRAYNVRAEYTIAALTDARVGEAAGVFVSFVLSSDGQRILRRYGFATP